MIFIIGCMLFLRTQKFFANRNSVTQVIGKWGVLGIRAFRSSINWPIIISAHRIGPGFKLLIP